MSICVVCRGEQFGPGPGGRRAVTGLMPRCEKCQSLERHRAIRSFFVAIYNADLFKSMKVMQFSNDYSVRSEWFNEYEVSIFGGNNSLDLQDIDRPSNVYDLVICNHVLEHVADDQAAMKELCRIIKADGVVFLSVPAPRQKKKTIDWGFANNDRHGHYREYGADITERFERFIPHVFVFQADLVDEITQTPDVAYLLVHQNSRILRSIRKSNVSVSLI